MVTDDIKPDRRYTKDHEWAQPDDGDLVVGITAFAVEQLGDITLVNIDLAEGDHVDAHAPFGTIESVKTLSDLFAPTAGTVVKINQALEETPELINQDCWGKGWMIRLKPDTDEAVQDLLDATAYEALVKSSDT